MEIMARRTQAQQIQAQNEQAALAFFTSMLEALPDPRRAQGTRYPLRTVVVTALMAMVCGCDDAEAMQARTGPGSVQDRRQVQRDYGDP